MDNFLPNDIAVIVLKYLASKGCESSVSAMIEDMPALKFYVPQKSPDMPYADYLRLLARPSFTPRLEDMLNDYGRAKSMVSEIMESQDPFKSPIRSSDSMVTQLKELKSRLEEIRVNSQRQKSVKGAANCTSSQVALLPNFLDKTERASSSFTPQIQDIGDNCPIIRSDDDSENRMHGSEHKELPLTIYNSLMTNSNLHEKLASVINNEVLDSKKSQSADDTPLKKACSKMESDLNLDKFLNDLLRDGTNDFIDIIPPSLLSPSSRSRYSNQNSMDSIGGLTNLFQDANSVICNDEQRGAGESFSTINSDQLQSVVKSGTKNCGANNAVKKSSPPSNLSKTESDSESGSGPSSETYIPKKRIVPKPVTERVNSNPVFAKVKEFVTTEQGTKYSFNEILPVIPKWKQLGRRSIAPKIPTAADTNAKDAPTTPRISTAANANAKDAPTTPKIPTATNSNAKDVPTTPTNPIAANTNAKDAPITPMIQTAANANAKDAPIVPKIPTSANTNAKDAPTTPRISTATNSNAKDAPTTQRIPTAANAKVVPLAPRIPTAAIANAKDSPITPRIPTAANANAKDAPIVPKIPTSANVDAKDTPIVPKTPTPANVDAKDALIAKSIAPPDSMTKSNSFPEPLITQPASKRKKLVTPLKRSPEKASNTEHNFCLVYHDPLKVVTPRVSTPPPLLHVLMDQHESFTPTKTSMSPTRSIPNTPKIVILEDTESNSLSALKSFEDKRILWTPSKFFDPPPTPGKTIFVDENSKAAAPKKVDTITFHAVACKQSADYSRDIPLDLSSSPIASHRMKEITGSAEKSLLSSSSESQSGSSTTDSSNTSNTSTSVDSIEIQKSTNPHFQIPVGAPKKVSPPTVKANKQCPVPIHYSYTVLTTNKDSSISHAKQNRSKAQDRRTEGGTSRCVHARQKRRYSETEVPTPQSPPSLTPCNTNFIIQGVHKRLSASSHQPLLELAGTIGKTSNTAMLQPQDQKSHESPEMPLLQEPSKFRNLLKNVDLNRFLTKVHNRDS